MIFQNRNYKVQHTFVQYFVFQIKPMASGNSEEEKRKTTSDETRKHVDKTGLVSENGKNINWLLCPYCDSKILQPNKGEYLEKEVSMLM